MKIKSILIAALMIASSVAAVGLQPEREPVKQRESIGLDAFLPKAFGEWKVDETVMPLVPLPEVEQKLTRIYEETLARTYVNASGERVMLSIAYGGDQTGRLRVHRPESCYTAQGFLVNKVAEEELKVGNVRVPVKRLIAQAGTRQEPITYWIRIGEENVTGLFGQRLVQLKSGLFGEVSDGLLFRVSSISTQTKAAYLLQDRFVADLIAALPVEQRAKLIGMDKPGLPN